MKHNNLSLLLIRYIKKYIFQIIVGIILMIISIFFSLYMPIILQGFIDNIANIDYVIILKLIGCIVGMLVFASLYRYIFSFSFSKYHRKRNIPYRIYAGALMKDINWHNSTHSGEVSSRIMNDASVLINFLADDLVGLFYNVFMVAGSLTMMFVIDWFITLIFLGAAPLILLTVRPISAVIYKLSEQKAFFAARINSYFVETISQIKLVKAYGKEKYESERGNAMFKDILAISKKNIVIQTILTPIMGAIALTLVLGVVLIGSLRVSYGFVTAGSLIAIVIYVFNMLQPVQDIASFFINLNSIKGTTQKLMLMLTENGEDVNCGASIKRVENLTFQDVVFKYKDNENIVLEGINIDIKRGEKVALIGESGAGKSTIFSLMERFYEPLSGKIMADGNIYSQYSLDSWRNLFGYVSQDNPLISGTIKENILYGVNRHVTEEELNRVVQDTKLNDLLDLLPDKVDAQVGEAGNRLSGGQKQRIAIARAILRNPEYLLLDEATANLDIESEENIQDTIRNLFRDKTTIVIAHHLATVINADKVIVLENGKITGVGSHEELYKNNSYY